MKNKPPRITTSVQVDLGLKLKVEEFLLEKKKKGLKVNFADFFTEAGEEKLKKEKFKA